MMSMSISISLALSLGRLWASIVRSTQSPCIIDCLIDLLIVESAVKKKRKSEGGK